MKRYILLMAVLSSVITLQAVGYSVPVLNKTKEPVVVVWGHRHDTYPYGHGVLIKPNSKVVAELNTNPRTGTDFIRFVRANGYKTVRGTAEDLEDKLGPLRLKFGQKVIGFDRSTDEPTVSTYYTIFGKREKLFSPTPTVIHSVRVPILESFRYKPDTKGLKLFENYWVELESWGNARTVRTGKRVWQ